MKINPKKELDIQNNWSLEYIYDFHSSFPHDYQPYFLFFFTLFRMNFKKFSSIWYLGSFNDMKWSSFSVSDISLIDFNNIFQFYKHLKSPYFKITCKKIYNDFAEVQIQIKSRKGFTISHPNERPFEIIRAISLLLGLISIFLVMISSDPFYSDNPFKNPIAVYIMIFPVFLFFLSYSPFLVEWILDKIDEILKPKITPLRQKKFVIQNFKKYHRVIKKKIYKMSRVDYNIIISDLTKIQDWIKCYKYDQEIIQWFSISVKKIQKSLNKYEKKRFPETKQLEQEYQRIMNHLKSQFKNFNEDLHESQYIDIESFNTNWKKYEKSILTGNLFTQWQKNNEIFKDICKIRGKLKDLKESSVMSLYTKQNEFNLLSSEHAINILKSEKILNEIKQFYNQISSSIEEKENIITKLFNLIQKKLLKGQFEEIPPLFETLKENLLILYGSKNNVEKYDSKIQKFLIWNLILKKEQNFNRINIVELSKELSLSEEIIINNVQELINNKEIVAQFDENTGALKVQGNLSDLFISYSIEEFDFFSIDKVAKQIIKFPEIANVYYWSRDNKIDKSIVRYMEENIQKSDIFLVFASKKAMNSYAVNEEIDWAVFLKKKIIPIFLNAKDLRLCLQPKRGIEFKQINERFFEDLHSLIKEI